MRRLTGFLFASALLLALHGMVWAQMPGTKLWDFNAGGRVNSSPALSQDGTIYFGAGNILHSLNPDGTPKWKYLAGGQIFSTPAVSPDGTLYFGCFDGKLYALAPNGTLKWTFETHGRIYSSPAFDSRGVIVFGSDDGRVYGVSMTGTQKWSFVTGGYVRSSPAVGADGSIYFGSWDRRLYCLNQDGNMNWSFEVDHYIYSSPAIAPDGTIYFGCVDSCLYAITPDGQKKWELSTDSHIYSSPVIGADGVIYVGSWDNRIYAVTPDGKVKWSYATGNLVQSSPAVTADGTVYCGSDENKIYAINPDGTKKWSYATGSLVRSSPIVSPDGTVYVGSEDNKLYAFKGVSGPAISSWPMFRADPRRLSRVLLLITRQPQNQVVVVGHEASFSVAASGPTPLGYQWRLNGTNVPGANSPQLVMTNVAPTQAGMYNVVISNDVESVVSANVQLTVIVAPVITEQPQPQQVAVGAAANIKVVASSLGPVTYKWFYNGGPIPMALSSSLGLNNIQLTNAGDYSVVVANAAGAVTSSVAPLMVVLPPQITIQPQSHVGAAGTEASFVAGATSSVPVAFQWRFNGANLAGATASNLVLKNIQQANGGNYVAVASNLGGSVTSAVATLTVDLPPVITAQPRSVTGIVGKPATLSVTAQSAGPATFQWLRGTNVLAGATETACVLTNVQADMAGAYQVAVKNIAGATTSAPIVLTVLHPPTVTTQPQSITTNVGARVLFTVTADGTPPLFYRWQCNGSNIANADESMFELPKISVDNVGRYAVVITNAAGAITSQVATLKIPISISLWERIKAWF